MQTYITQEKPGISLDYALGGGGQGIRNEGDPPAPDALWVEAAATEAPAAEAAATEAPAAEAAATEAPAAEAPAAEAAK
ncbi:hypothetical protein [Neisseria meningitidis]|uniref:hypothetical protein n=1 Tax=Neisseria meningitidis TaxID=487 RepID=UPI0011CEBE61|nr:hypothetical protein [Neisseria meningitidis]